MDLFEQLSKYSRGWTFLICACTCCWAHGLLFAGESPDRRFEPGDAVEVDVHLEPKASGTFTVDQLGQLKLPLLGVLDVKGKTEPELAAQVESALRKSFIREASVTVHITQRREMSVSVLGKIGAPGKISFQAGQTLGLYQALVAAGMPTKDADIKQIEVVRQVGDTIKTVTVNAQSERNYPLQEGDTVVVPALPPELASQNAARLVTMLGQVAHPGRVEIPLGEPLDLLTAIAKAGGLTRTARESKVTIHRKRDGEREQTLVVDFAKIQRGDAEPFLLQDGDTVFVPESFF